MAAWVLPRLGKCLRSLVVLLLLLMVLHQVAHRCRRRQIRRLLAVLGSAGVTVLVGMPQWLRRWSLRLVRIVLQLQQLLLLLILMLLLLSMILLLLMVVLLQRGQLL